MALETARIRSGVLKMDDRNIQIVHKGAVGDLSKALHPLFNKIVNLDLIIPINKIDKVKYKKGLNFIMRPRIKLYYNGRMRRIAFKPPFTSRAEALEEMNKVINFLRNKGIAIEEG